MKKAKRKSMSGNEKKGRDNETISLLSSIFIVDEASRWTINKQENKLLGQVFRLSPISFYEVKIHSTRAWGQWRKHYRYPFLLLIRFLSLHHHRRRRRCRLSFFFCCLTRPSYHKRKTNRQLESEKVCGRRSVRWFHAVFRMKRVIPSIDDGKANMW